MWSVHIRVWVVEDGVLVVSQSSHEAVHYRDSVEALKPGQKARADYRANMQQMDIVRFSPLATAKLLGRSASSQTKYGRWTLPQITAGIVRGFPKGSTGADRRPVTEARVPALDDASSVRIP